MKDAYYDKETQAAIDLVYDTVDNEDGWIITRIRVPIKNRGNGYASKLLKQVLTEADKEGTTLRLWILPTGDLTYEQLEAWYKRYGFVDDKEPGYLKRTPVAEGLNV